MHRGSGHDHIGEVEVVEAVLCIKCDAVQYARCLQDALMVELGVRIAWTVNRQIVALVVGAVDAEFGGGGGVDGDIIADVAIDSAPKVTLCALWTLNHGLPARTACVTRNVAIFVVGTSDDLIFTRIVGQT